MTKPHPGYKIGTPYKRRGRLWSLGWHTGDDWLTPTGTKAHAMADGVVRAVSTNAAYGRNVIVESTAAGKRVRWSFNHLSSVAVKTGQLVKAGQVIARTGATGNVTGPHNHVEARVSPYSFAAGNFRDPQLMYDWTPPAAARPSWTTRRPKVAPARWYRIAAQNLGGMNDHGRATYRDRYPKIVADVRDLAPDVFCTQEVANPQVGFFDGLMADIGYKRVAGSDGRYIYVRRATKVKAHGVYDLEPRWENDTKQAAWAIVALHGFDALVVSGHLESDDAAGADPIRVKQARSQLEQAEATAKAHGLSVTRICHATDTNSDNLVREQAFNEAHYVDAAETAWKYANLLLATFKGWSKSLRAGARIDTINVHRARPVVFYGTRRHNAGAERDHLMIVADIGIIHL